MKVVLAGGTGYIGRPLTRALLKLGHQTTVLTRKTPRQVVQLPSETTIVRWDAAPDGGWTRALADADAVVNLTGVRVAGRPWTRRRRQQIISSRIQTTRAVLAALSGLSEDRRPRTLVNASGVEFYGDSGDDPVDETANAGRSFLAGVCIGWERAACKAERLGLRVLRMRTGVVFSDSSPSFRLIALSFRIFAGSPFGAGRQWVSWVHLDDVVGLYLLALNDSLLAGPVNVVAPEPSRAADLAAELGRALHRPTWRPVPIRLLRAMLGEQADLLLHGQRAVPAVAESRGYLFRHRTLAGALAASLGRN